MVRGGWTGRARAPQAGPPEALGPAWVRRREPPGGRPWNTAAAPTPTAWPTRSEREPASGQGLEVAGPRGATSPPALWGGAGPGKMLDLLVLKIEDPGCFWVIIKGCSPFLDHEVDYKKLNSAMNKFYNGMCQDTEVKPLVLEEGQVCVVYCQELKCWCRAIIKSIVSSADHYQAECFLVDFAKYIPVKLKNIRVAMESFLQLPYRAKKFRLYCTKPVTLHIDFCEDSAGIVPSRKWDSAAIQYFQSVIKETTQVEAKLCAVEEDTFEVYLYVTMKNEKVCVNDNLVAKNFAYYVSPMENKKSLDCLEKPRMNINSASFSSKLNPALTLWPMFLQRTNCQEMKSELTFLAQSLPRSWLNNVNKGPTVTVPDQTLKNNTDSLRNLPKKTLDEEQQCIPLEDVNKCVESSVNWPTKRGITIYAEPDLSAPSTSCQKPNEKSFRLAEKKEYNEKNGCVKLLQFLNPDPLKAGGISDLQQLQKLKSGMQQSLVVLRNKVEPCLSNDVLPLSPHLKKPLAVIVCPGWKKAQFIFELLGDYIASSRPLHPMLLTIGLNKDEAKNMKLPRGCDMIVTTPHSLQRLLKYQSLLFLRLCHLILDEADILFVEANEQMLAILDNFKKYTEERESAPRQIVAVGVHWNKHIEHLTKEFMSDPYVVITTLKEAALYGSVQQIVHLCLESEKTSTLLQTFDFVPSQAQKTLIFTCSEEETEMVSKVIECNSIFCLKMHSGLIYNLKSVLEQWKKKLNSGSHIALALTDNCIPLLAITDATCVIHFSFPSSPKIFGGRLYCMSDHFQSLTEQGFSAEQGDRKTKSVLLLTEKNASYAVGVLHYLERADAKIPPELYEFTKGLLVTKEERKARRPLCPSLKSFGFCKNKRTCPDRHQINPEIDMPNNTSNQALPKFGYIKIIPFYIMNATKFLGRIIDKHVDLYVTLNAEMNQYFEDSSNKTVVEKVERFGLYGLAEKAVFYRVQVLEMSPNEDTCIQDNVLVKFIDEGKTELVKRDQLLQLPEHFHTLPPQAVEFIVCRVKPADDEVEWNPKVTRFIHHKIIGKTHDAKVILALGNTVWIDPMVHITKLSNLKTSIIDYNVRAEILSMGMGVDNSEHIEQLGKLYKEAKMPDFEEYLSQISPPASAEDVADPQSTQPEDKDSEGATNSGADIQDHKPEPLHENTKGAPMSKTAEPVRSFHPHIKWFQKDDVVILKVKLRNVRDYKCKYFQDRVVFSAWVEDRFYLADMALQGNIIMDDSKCLIQNEEPVITLAKEKKESWCSLLKQKIPNVTFDFDHWEECEEENHFSKVVHSKPLSFKVPEVVEDSESTSEEDESMSE